MGTRITPAAASGSVTTTLVYGSMSMKDISFSGVDDPVIFDSQDTNVGGILTNFTTMTIPAGQGGLYSLAMDGDVDLDEANSSGRFVYVVKNNTNPVDDAAAATASIMKAQLQTGTTEFGVMAFSSSKLLTLVAGDTLIVYFAAAAGTDRMKTANFVVQKLPVQSNVNIVPQSPNVKKGTFSGWDVAAATGFLTVSGDIATAEAVAAGATGDVKILFVTPFSNAFYTIIFNLIGVGTAANDDDARGFHLRNKTASGFDIHAEEVNSVGQNFNGDIYAFE